MKLRTENGIRSFLIRISKHCEKTDCSHCPFLIVDNINKTTLFNCVWRESSPMGWNVNDIMERYKNIE